MTDSPPAPLGKGGDAGLEHALSPFTKAFSGQVSVALRRFADDLTFGLKADALMPAASLIKLPVMLTVLSQVDAGQLALERRVSVTTDDRVGGSGVLKALRAGLSLTVYDLLTLMIIVSDNTATNLLIDLVGLEAVNSRCRALGLTRTGLVGKLQLPESQQNAAQRAGRRNQTTATDMLTLLTRLARAEGLALGEVALTIMKQQQCTEALARYLPTDRELYENPVQVASKSGCLRGVWHDAGIVCDHAGTPLYALVVMTCDGRDHSFGWEQEGMMVIARVSRRVYEYLCRDG